MDIIEKLNTLNRIEYILKTTIQCLGLIGSLLMLVVYYQASLRKLSLSIYFRYAAVICAYRSIDQLVLNQLYVDIGRISQFLGALAFYLSNLFVPISVWLEVAVSLDRLVTILFPYRFTFIQKTLFKCLVIAGIFIVNMGLYLFHLIGTGYLFLISGISENDTAGRLTIRNFKILLDLMSSAAIPFAIMLVASIAILAGVLKARRRIKTTRLGRTASQRKFLRDINFGVTMIVLNGLFFIFIGIFRMNVEFGINPFNRKTHFLSNLVFEYIVFYLSDFYYMLNFYFQLAINSLIRKELVGMFARILRKIKRRFCIHRL